MDWSSGLAWLTTLTARRAQRPAELDHADMGTAFGLDASLMPPGDWALDAHASGATRVREPFERRVVRRFSA